MFFETHVYSPERNVITEDNSTKLHCSVTAVYKGVKNLLKVIMQ